MATPAVIPGIRPAVLPMDRFVTALGSAALADAAAQAANVTGSRSNVRVGPVELQVRPQQWAANGSPARHQQHQSQPARLGPSLPRGALRMTVPRQADGAGPSGGATVRGWIRVVVQQGNAGFKCDDGLCVTWVQELGAASREGVKPGMRLTKWMDQDLVITMPWKRLTEIVRQTPQPWIFTFAEQALIPLSPVDRGQIPGASSVALSAEPRLASEKGPASLRGSARAFASGLAAVEQVASEMQHTASSLRAIAEGVPLSRRLEVAEQLSHIGSDEERRHHVTAEQAHYVVDAHTRLSDSQLADVQSAQVGQAMHGGISLQASGVTAGGTLRSPTTDGGGPGTLTDGPTLSPLHTQSIHTASEAPSATLTLLAFLQRVRLEQYLPALEALGATTPIDMHDMRAHNFVEIGMKKLEQNRLQKAVESLVGGATPVVLGEVVPDTTPEKEDQADLKVEAIIQQHNRQVLVITVDSSALEFQKTEIS